MNPNDDFIGRAERVMKDRPSAGQFYVLNIDITNFSTVNLVYGSAAGDVLLREMEGFLKQNPFILLCSRTFADFYLCLYVHTDDTADIRETMDVWDDKAQAFLNEQHKHYPACMLRASCGVCHVEDGDIAQAINNANVARKVSKKQLRARAILYSRDMQERASAWHRNEQEIYTAMQEGRFCFYLQPKVDLTTGEIVGAEALARRIDENGAVIYPDSFLEVMESNGTVIELDRMICRQVCAFLSERLRKGLPAVCISVNLSRLHIQNSDTADEFHAIATQYQIPPNLLEFELTETILLEEFSGAKQLINQLRAYGYRVSIDDFGSGYAGINIWQELNFDCLKLDRKFLSEDSILKQRNEALVPNIINIAQRLHVQVLCEGVETEEQCQYLLRLGCTMVQGFFFSKPMPPDQLCQMCERQGQKYALPPALRFEKRGEEPQWSHTLISRGQMRTKVKLYVVVIVLCALFLGVCITGVLTFNRNLTHREFIRMVTDTLNAYTVGQRENTLAEIDGVAGTLQSMAVLFERNGDQEFIDTYLLALNEDSTDVIYMYLSYEAFLQSVADGTARESDIPILDRLKNGETVVTDITHSQRLGGIYCIAVGVPVMRDGTFVGVVRGIINAQALVSTELYDPAQGEIVSAFLTDGDGVVLPIRSSDGWGVGDRLTDRLAAGGIGGETLEELASALAADDAQARSIRLGKIDGSPYYLSLISLKYNDWHFVVCLKADAAVEHFQSIVHNTAVSIAGLIIAVLLVSSVLVLFIRKMQRKFSIDEQRYLLLERFSDTVLFDYDCRRDKIRFTSNASKLMRIHEVAQRDFLGRQEEIYVYAGDQEEMRRMLTGRTDADVGEIRVRLMRPDADEYFWCLIQYQLLYDKETLASVIGKITDIDERMRHEDYLVRMSETDGLTGLLNKAAVEKQAADRLGQVSKGLLFIIDVDGFKQINDRYGHAAGDLSLRCLGDCMRRTYRTRDILGRIGGDELLAFIGEVDDRDIAQKKAELLERHLESSTEAGIPPLSVSIGIARFPADGETFSALFHAADQAMYAAKQNGKRQLCFYESISVEHSR